MPGRCIVDANVCPMTSPDTRAEAICWDEDGTILAVGSNDEVQAVATAQGIPVESMPGHTIIPGFVDAHMHFLHVGLRQLCPDLRESPSLKDALQTVADWLEQHPGDGPVIAEGWDESLWPEARFPTKAEVDSLTTKRPLVLRRMCGHFAVANSTALPAIRANWDDDGLVNVETGVIKEQPSLYLNEVMPVTDADLDKAVQVATDVAHHLGVTLVGEYTQAPHRRALLRAADAGKLRIRIANHIYVQQLHDAISNGFRTPTPRGTGNRLRDGGLKVFLDGSFGGRTAWLREPYRDDPDTDANHGTPIWTDDECLEWFRTAHEAGIQITAHVIGDAAVDQGLDAYEKILDSKQGLELRHRFEHYELPQDDAVERTIELGITACAQPNFLGEWSAKGGMYEQRLGPVFALNNRYRTYLNKGMSLCFGSDGMPFGPLYGIQAAVDHPFPEERITPSEAVWLYTARAAWASHWDDCTGTLEAGKQADALVVDVPNLDARPATEWLLKETILDGQTVCRNDRVMVQADAGHTH